MGRAPALPAGAACPVAGEVCLAAGPAAVARQAVGPVTTPPVAEVRPVGDRAKIPRETEVRPVEVPAAERARLAAGPVAATARLAAGPVEATATARLAVDPVAATARLAVGPVAAAFQAATDPEKKVRAARSKRRGATTTSLAEASPRSATPLLAKPLIAQGSNRLRTLAPQIAGMIADNAVDHGSEKGSEYSVIQHTPLLASLATETWPDPTRTAD